MNIYLVGTLQSLQSEFCIYWHFINVSANPRELQRMDALVTELRRGREELLALASEATERLASNALEGMEGHIRNCRKLLQRRKSIMEELCVLHNYTDSVLRMEYRLDTTSVSIIAIELVTR